jgi:hypothetical protein
LAGRLSFLVFGAELIYWKEQLMKQFLVVLLLFGGISVAQDASLYIVNDSKGGGFAMRPLTLKVLDGRTELASVKNHQTVKVSIKPGVHGLALKIANKDITVLTAKPGETYFLRVSVDQGFAYAGTRCMLMKPEEAVYWIPAAQQFIKDTPLASAVSAPAPQPAPVAAAPISPTTIAPIRDSQSTIVDTDLDPNQSLGEAARRARAKKQKSQPPKQ